MQDMEGTATFSARFQTDLLDRLEARKRQAAQSRSRLAERYIDEGLRMDEHPGIVFRDGPTGRRAALAAGPDVWELMRFWRGLSSKGPAAIRKTSKLLNLTPLQIETALRYYADYPDEIDERIRLNEEEGKRAEAAWRRQQAALG
jgi:hypothetical protein